MNNNKLNITEKSYFRTIELESLLNITPYNQQRSINNNRVKIIAKVIFGRLKSNNFKSFNFVSPIIFVRTNNSQEILLDYNNNRVSTCIVDGQHRLQALKELQLKYNKIKYITVPILVHIINNIEEADQVQYNLFEQKPFSEADKIRKSKYKIDYVIENVINKLRYKYNKFIKTNNMSKRKNHFNIDKFKNKITNSDNINIWIERQITYDELYSSFLSIIKDRNDEYNIMRDIKDELTFLQLKKTPKKSKLIDFTKMTYYYYKRYDMLIKDIEDKLEIHNDSDDDSTDDD